MIITILLYNVLAIAIYNYCTLIDFQKVQKFQNINLKTTVLGLIYHLGSQVFISTIENLLLYNKATSDVHT